MRFSELADRRVGVWGVAREARSLARLLGERLPGARLAVVATDAPAEPEALAPFLAAGAEPVHGAAILPALRGCDVVVRSPGVSVYRDELAALRAAGVPVATATGLWMAEPHAAPVVGVTGTKGKSTTATLIAHLLRAAGRTAELAGNVGRPALELLEAPVPDVYVLELSSYQVADLDAGPDLAVLTNLYREHLDWHGSEERYRADKLRLADLRAGRRLQRRRPGPGGARRRGRARSAFGAAPGYHVTAAGVCDGARSSCPPGAPRCAGRTTCSTCAPRWRRCGGSARTPATSRRGARRLPRACPTGSRSSAERDGVLWIDDSISTTPESALAAVGAFPERPVVLIGGGYDRGQDYAGLGAELARRGARVIGLPTTGARLVAAARAAGVAGDRATEAAGLEEAVAAARGRGRRGRRRAALPGRAQLRRLPGLRGARAPLPRARRSALSRGRGARRPAARGRDGARRGRLPAGRRGVRGHAVRRRRRRGRGVPAARRSPRSSCGPSGARACATTPPATCGWPARSAWRSA